MSETNEDYIAGRMASPAVTPKQFAADLTVFAVIIGALLLVSVGYEAGAPSANLAYHAAPIDSQAVTHATIPMNAERPAGVDCPQSNA